jgi:hypothetical protein
MAEWTFKLKSKRKDYRIESNCWNDNALWSLSVWDWSIDTITTCRCNIVHTTQL